MIIQISRLIVPKKKTACNILEGGGTELNDLPVCTWRTSSPRQKLSFQSISTPKNSGEKMLSNLFGMRV